MNANSMEFTRMLRRIVFRVCAFALVGSFIPTTNADTASSFRVQSLKEIRERSVVMQRLETSCAAAAVATVLTYGFQDRMTERYAVTRMLENTEPAKVRSRGGFSLLDIKLFVEDEGYRGEAYQYLSLEDLKLFHAPIVPIRVNGLNHYVVLNAVEGDRVLLADPAFGNRAMPLARFKEVWMTGLAFVVTAK
jgi:predicted double-glycine peptidase